MLFRESRSLPDLLLTQVLLHSWEVWALRVDLYARVGSENLCGRDGAHLKFPTCQALWVLTAPSCSQKNRNPPWSALPTPRQFQEPHSTRNQGPPRGEGLHWEPRIQFIHLLALALLTCSRLGPSCLWTLLVTLSRWPDSKWNPGGVA